MVVGWGGGRGEGTQGSGENERVGLGWIYNIV